MTSITLRCGYHTKYFACTLQDLQGEKHWVQAYLCMYAIRLDLFLPFHHGVHNERCICTYQYVYKRNSKLVYFYERLNLFLNTSFALLWRSQSLPSIFVRNYTYRLNIGPDSFIQEVNRYQYMQIYTLSTIQTNFIKYLTLLQEYDCTQICTYINKHAEKEKRTHK